MDANHYIITRYNGRNAAYYVAAVDKFGADWTMFRAEAKPLTKAEVFQMCELATGPL